MPKKTTVKRKTLKHKVKHTRPMHGAGVLDTIKSGASKVNKFLRNTQIISRGAKLLTPVLGPEVGLAGTIVGALGYGKVGKGRTKLERGMLP